MILVLLKVDLEPLKKSYFIIILNSNFIIILKSYFIIVLLPHVWLNDSLKGTGVFL